MVLVDLWGRISSGGLVGGGEELGVPVTEAPAPPPSENGAGIGCRPHLNESQRAVNNVHTPIMGF